MAKKQARMPQFSNYVIMLDTETNKYMVINQNSHHEVKRDQDVSTTRWTLHSDGGEKKRFYEKDFDLLFNNNQTVQNMATGKKGAAASRSQKQAETATATNGQPAPVAETAPEKTAEEIQAEKDKKAADKKAEKEAAAAKQKEESANKLATVQASIPAEGEVTKEQVKAARDSVKGFKFTVEDRKAFNEWIKAAGDRVKKEAKAPFVKANGEPRKVLTVEEVIQIRGLLAEKKGGDGEDKDQPKYTIPEIAKQFGTLKRTIRGIRDGRRFAAIGLGEVGAAEPATA